MSLDTGTTTYFGDDTGSFDTGVVNSTPPVTTSPPDASGGGGSYLPALLPTLTSGLNAVLAANLNQKFGQGLASGLATVDAQGNLTYKATPAPVPSAAQAATANALSSLPVILLAVGGLILLAAVLRR